MHCDVWGVIHKWGYCDCKQLSCWSWSDTTEPLQLYGCIQWFSRFPCNILLALEVSIHNYPENLNLSLRSNKLPPITKGSEPDLYAFRVKRIIALYLYSRCLTVVDLRPWPSGRRQWDYRWSVCGWKSLVLPRSTVSLSCRIIRVFFQQSNQFVIASFHDWHIFALIGAVDASCDFNAGFAHRPSAIALHLR